MTRKRLNIGGNLKISKVWKLFLLIIIFIKINSIFAADKEVLRHCLLNLQMSELLRLQHSLESIKTEEQWSNSSLAKQNENLKSIKENVGKMSVEINESCPTQNCMRPMAMALTGQPRGYHVKTVYHPWQPEEKQSKLQTLFNVSVTALAFLAFGGYLLCLIVQAIKSKGTTYFHPVATTSTTTNGGVKRIKIYRRGRRETTAKMLNFNNEVWVMNYGYGNWF